MVCKFKLQLNFNIVLTKPMIYENELLKAKDNAHKNFCWYYFIKTFIFTVSFFLVIGRKISEKFLNVTLILSLFIK